MAPPIWRRFHLWVTIMGQRGPKRLPDNVLRMRGSRYVQNRATGDSVDPEIEIPGCPRHLLPEARKEWKRIAPELEQLGLIAMIDRTALAIYCQEWAWWVWHDEALQRAVKLAEEKRAAFAADPANAGQPWTGGDGFQIPTPNGHLTYNPHWVARNKAAQALDRYLASFGLSPSARGRVTPSSRQMPLPGVPPAGGFAAL